MKCTCKFVRFFIQVTYSDYLLVGSIPLSVLIVINIERFLVVIEIMKVASMFIMGREWLKIF